MAIVENRSSEIGDVICIQTNTPVIGITALNSFVDNTDDETASRFFDKEFRYSFDGGITFSSWIDLTNANLMDVPVQRTDVFVIEYRYIRTGTDPAGTIAFNNVLVDTDFDRINCGNAFISSVYGQFLTCDNLCSLNWAINVLEKLYNNGVLPQYIERRVDQDENVNLRRDQDFIDFWFTNTLYFSYLVCYARIFENFINNRDLTLEYDKQRDLFICDDEELQNVVYLANNYHHEIAKRGTYRMFEAIDNNGVELLGEFHRLICRAVCDDFTFSLTRPENLGWRLGSSSPMFREVQLQDGTIKNPTWSDPNNIPTFGSGTSVTTVDGVEVVQISGDNSIVPSGIGWDNSQSSIFEDGIIVDPNYDYLLTVQMRQETLGDYLSLGVDAFDNDGNQYNLLSVIDNVPSNDFFVNESLNQAGRFYTVKAIIYGRHQPPMSENQARLNIGFGRHLKFSDARICRIIPRIGVLTPIQTTPPPPPIPSVDFCGGIFGSGGQGVTRVFDVTIPTGFAASNGFFAVRLAPDVATDQCVLVVDGNIVASTGRDANSNYGRPTPSNPNPTFSNPGEFDPDAFRIYNDPTENGFNGSRPTIPLPVPNNNFYVNGDAVGSRDTTEFGGNYWYVGGAIAPPYTPNPLPNRVEELENEFSVDMSHIPFNTNKDQMVYVPIVEAGQSGGVQEGQTIECWVFGPNGTFWNVLVECPQETPDTPDDPVEPPTGFDSIFASVQVSPRHTPYSNCFLNEYNFIKLWLKNNNPEINNTLLDSIIRQKMIPYNSWFRTTHLDDYRGEEVPDETIDLCEIIEGEITNTTGVTKGVSHIENELLIELEPCPIDVFIDDECNLIVTGEGQHILGYSIDQQTGELQFTTPVPRII